MLRKVPSPTAVDFHPPLKGAHMVFRYMKRSESTIARFTSDVESPVRVAEVHELVGVLRVVAVEVVVAEREHELAAQERLHLHAGQLAVESLGAEERDIAQVDAERAVNSSTMSSMATCRKSVRLVWK